VHTLNLIICNLYGMGALTLNLPKQRVPVPACNHVCTLHITTVCMNHCWKLVGSRLLVEFRASWQDRFPFR
jgi:hypothetical protein